MGILSKLKKKNNEVNNVIYKSYRNDTINFYINGVGRLFFLRYYFPYLNTYFSYKNLFRVSQDILKQCLSYSNIMFCNPLTTKDWLSGSYYSCKYGISIILTAKQIYIYGFNKILFKFKTSQRGINLLFGFIYILVYINLQNDPQYNFIKFLKGFSSIEPNTVTICTWNLTNYLYKFEKFLVD